MVAMRGKGRFSQSDALAPQTILFIQASIGKTFLPQLIAMTNSTMLWVFCGCLLGAVQLVVGLGLGIWLHRRRPTRDDRLQDVTQAGCIAQKLQALADDMSSSVGEHRHQLEEAGRQLAATNAGSADRVAELVANVIGNVVHANHTLQSRLMSAEVRLQEQADEIEAHMSRALTDALTGLPNRRAFNESLEANMASWRKRGQSFTLLMLDVDHFKQLNDRFGHVAGDHVLTTVAASLRATLRSSDIVARYGGEEFAMLLPSTTLEQALTAAEKAVRAIADATTAYQGTEFRVTVSGGLAAICAEEDSAGLVRRADAALYAAKGAGRNCVFVHDGRRTLPLGDLRSRSAPSGSAASNTEADQLQSLLAMIESLMRHNDYAAALDAPTDKPSSKSQVSHQLAQTCEELRRCLESRESVAQESTSMTKSAAL